MFSSKFIFRSSFFISWVLFLGLAFGTAAEVVSGPQELAPEVVATSLVDHSGRQRILLLNWDSAQSGTPTVLEVTTPAGDRLAEAPVEPESAAESGNSAKPKSTAKPEGAGKSESPEGPVSAFFAMLPKQQASEGQDVCWVFRDAQGKTLISLSGHWNAPRHWTIYVVSSTHCDIGLHNSQYVQRKMSGDYADRAAALIDQTQNWPDASRYRYVMEGTWFWGNYEQDRSEAQAQEFVRKYVLPGQIGIGCMPAGNHTQSYGFEELCRSTYKKQMMSDRWGIPTETMVMADNNGISWSMVGPCHEAGIRGILFSPNQWNPLPSTIWPKDESIPGATWNPDAGGGGSRVDVRWDSPLPMVFYWQGADPAAKILVWCSTQYGMGGHVFDFNRKAAPDYAHMAAKVARQLRKMEARYPFDVWLFAQYSDDEAPNLRNAELCREWNDRWASPEFRTTGNLNEPFQKLREKFDAQIPTLRGDMTCGWAQHTICAPEILARKFAADRALPTAEKLAALASLLDPQYVYPSVEFRRAWDALLWNDEHSYGTSGYRGRRVYETWLQHRDWVSKAQAVADFESQRAMQALAAQFETKEPSLVLFNPTLTARQEIIETKRTDGRSVRFLTPEVGPLDLTFLPLSQLEKLAVPEVVPEPAASAPTIENRFYRLVFAADGSIASIFDKSLNRELLDPNAKYRANQFVYTNNNHQSFVTPKDAAFTVLKDSLGVTVEARMEEPCSQAEIIQKVFLPNDEKYVQIENQLLHVRDLINTNRYYRYGYYAFPFLVPDGKFHVQLNGVMAEPKRDVTGHGTDVYLAARDFAGVQNADFGVELIQLDSHLVEFGRIAPDKTDFGRPLESTHLYSYVFTDWLQMHQTGGSYVNPRFRYVITSHPGSFTEAQTARFAERFTTPLAVTETDAHSGRLAQGQSLNVRFFLDENFPSNVTLLTLKRSEKPGEGVIARFHETEGRPASLTLRGLGTVTRTTLTEQAQETFFVGMKSEEAVTQSLRPTGFLTLQFLKPQFVDSEDSAVSELKAEPISDVCVKLTWQPPKALKGQPIRYYVFRGSFDGFKPDEFHLAATVTQPEFTDENLNPGTDYFYRIQAEAPQSLGRVSPVLRTASLTTAQHDSAPAPIGSVYSGLVTTPKAAAGEDPDLLYLEWGQNQESDLSHYELYRSTESGFEPSETTFLAKVEPGPYRVGLYADRKLGVHSTYYYRVRAVDLAGNRGPFSAEFSGTTKEPIRE